MAFVTDIMPGPGADTTRMHRTCSATWRLADRAGERVLQLDTYGSPERQDQGTVSQSIQLDATRAQELLDVLRGVFPNLR